MRSLMITVRDTITDAAQDKIESAVGLPIHSVSDDGAGRMFLHFIPPRYVNVRQRRAVVRKLRKSGRLARWQQYPG